MGEGIAVIAGLNVQLVFGGEIVGHGCSYGWCQENMSILQVAGLSRRAAQLCAAFRDFDVKRTGKIHRTFLEALIHLSVDTELTSSEAQQLSDFLDGITDACENVEYEAFVGWLYAPGSYMPELVRVSRPNQQGSRPLSGRTLRYVVRPKIPRERGNAPNRTPTAQKPCSARASSAVAGRGIRYTTPAADGQAAGVWPPRPATTWPSVGSARSARLSQQGGRRASPCPKSNEPRYDFPGSRARSAGARPKLGPPQEMDVNLRNECGSRRGYRLEEPWKSPLPYLVSPEGLARQLGVKALLRSDVERQEQQDRKQQVIEQTRKEQEIQQHRYYVEKLVAFCANFSGHLQALCAEEHLAVDELDKCIQQLAPAEVKAGIGEAAAAAEANDYDQCSCKERQMREELEICPRGDADSSQWLAQQVLRQQEEKEAQDPSEHLAVDELDKCIQQLAPAEVIVSRVEAAEAEAAEAGSQDKKAKDLAEQMAVDEPYTAYTCSEEQPAPAEVTVSRVEAAEAEVAEAGGQEQCSQEDRWKELEICSREDAEDSSQGLVQQQLLPKEEDIWQSHSVAYSAIGTIGEDTSGRAIPSPMSRRTFDQNPVTREEFEILKAELVLCKAEIGSLKAKIEVLESERGLDFEVVSSAPSASAAPASALPAESLPADRAEIAAEIGKWVGKALKGQRRGLSGREKIALQSRLYLVFRDIQGRDHNPPLFFSTWKETKDLCSLRGQLGDSLFVGLPSKAEARIVASGSEACEEVPITLRNSFVCESEKTINFSYPVGILSFELSAQSCNVISVVDVDGKVLVAVPDSVWHKKKAKRHIPADALSKAVRVSVQSCRAQERDTPRGEPDLAVWLGLLKSDYEDLATFELDEGAVADVSFPVDSAGLMLLPYAASLVAIARDHFTFLSAESGHHTAGGRDQEARIAGLESALDKIMQKLDALGPKGLAQPSQAAASHAGRGARPKQQQRHPADLEAPPGLDPGLVQQAAGAGVSRAALVEMAKFMQSQPAGAPADRVPLAPPGEDSSAEEDAGEGEVADGGLHDPVSKAVVQLTQIVKDMHKEKDKVQKRGGLDEILDRAESGSQKEPGVSTRSRAAALRALQKLLHTNPTLIYQSLERRLQEDWDSSEALPGVAASQISARGWVEHRSKIQGYMTSIRYSWILAGIWDCLRLGKHEEARARAALGVACVDQQSIDRGSFLLAGELTLEEAPPIHSFANHQLPESWESPHTRLVDGRWLELIMAKLKDIAEFQEKKAKLTPSKRVEEVKPGPKADPAKPKGKKGKGSGKGEEKSSPPVPESPQ
eukprot:s110_g10.t2